MKGHALPRRPRWWCPACWYACVVMWIESKWDDLLYWADMADDEDACGGCR